MADESTKSDTTLIKEYFELTPKQMIADIKGGKLTMEDRAQLANGIRDGSLTY